MIGTNLAITTKNYAAGGAVAYDADAVAFFTAASITDTTQKNAVNQLVLDLKSANIWTKMKALYPIVGGVASSHAVNLKTPGTYNLTFATGWTHSSTGMTPNGATYADTNLIHNNVLSQDSWSAGIYSRTNRSGTSGVSFGVVQASGYSLIYTRTTSNNFYCIVNSLTDSAVNVNNSIGFFQIKRDSSTSVKLIKNSTVNSFNQTSTTKNTISFYLGARNQDGTASSFDDEQLAFSYISEGLTDAEALSFYNAVQNYQTTLGRQV